MFHARVAGSRQAPGTEQGLSDALPVSLCFPKQGLELAQSCNQASQGYCLTGHQPGSNSCNTSRQASGLRQLISESFHSFWQKKCNDSHEQQGYVRLPVAKQQEHRGELMGSQINKQNTANPIRWEHKPVFGLNSGQACEYGTG